MRLRRAWVGGGFLVAGLALSAAVRGSGVRIESVDGVTLKPFEPAGRASVVFFIARDCPISNAYAPEIQRVCREYGAKGVECSLMYEDIEAPGARLDGEVRAHRHEYGYRDMPAAIDRSRAIANRVKATITPQAVVVDRSGAIRYRGRIDNFYAALGVARQQVTERDLRLALDAVLSGAPVAKPETEAVGCYIADPAVLRK